MRFKALWSLPLLACFLASPVVSAEGKIYSWEDEKGNLHFVDALNQVPEKYRKAAAERADKGQMAGDKGGGTMNIVVAPVAPAAPAAATPATPAATDAATADKSKKDPNAKAVPAKPTPKEKVYWTNLMQEWRDTKAKAEAELQGLDAELLKVRTTTPANFQQSLADIEAKRARLQATIAEADRKLTTDIPSEARKMGVPPGWLR